MGQPDEEYAELQARAEAVELTVDGRWGVARLREEVEAAEAAMPGVEEATPAEIRDAPIEDETGEFDEPPLERMDKTDTDATRAGGHIDRGDGRGWMVEESP